MNKETGEWIRWRNEKEQEEKSGKRFVSERERGEPFPRYKQHDEDESYCNRSNGTSTHLHIGCEHQYVTKWAFFRRTKKKDWEKWWKLSSRRMDRTQEREKENERKISFSSILFSSFSFNRIIYDDVTKRWREAERKKGRNKKMRMIKEEMWTMTSWKFCRRKEIEIRTLGNFSSNGWEIQIQTANKWKCIKNCLEIHFSENGLFFPSFRTTFFSSFLLQTLLFLSPFWVVSFPSFSIYSF